MVNRLLILSLITLSAAALSGCIPREEADERLARGCAAGAATLLPEGTAIGQIKEKIFTPSSEGINVRHVTLKVTQMDGYLEETVDYDCDFEEQFSGMKKDHVASLVKIKVNDQTIGRSGNVITGDFETISRLNDAVRKAMYE